MKKENNGAVSIFALLSMMFFLIFIVVAYNNVMQKGKMQVETTEILVDYYKSIPNTSELTNSMNDGNVKLSKLRGADLKAEVLKSNSNNKYVYSNGKLYKVDNVTKEEYQQVSYIEASGTQRIDTNYYPKPNTKIETRVYRTAKTEYSNPYGCDHHGISGFTFEMYYNLYGGNCRWDRGTSENGYSSQLAENTNYIITQDDKNCYIDGSLVAIVSDNSNDTSRSSLILFARNSKGDNPFYGRIYYFKIYYNGELIRDFIPCYSKTVVTNVYGNTCPTGTIGMYDLINSAFYTNIGTGTFTKGPDI